MKFGNTVHKSLATCALLAVSTLAQAGPYFGLDPVAQKAAFVAAVAQVATEDFEKVTTGFVSLQTESNVIDAIKVFGTFGHLTQSSTLFPALGANVTKVAGTDGRSNTTTGGAYWVESDADFTILLGRDVEAFGFFGTDFGDFGAVLAIALYNNGAVVVEDVFTDGNKGSLIPKSTSNGGLTFLGYASSTDFDEIRFKIRQTSTSSDSFDIFGFDDLIVGNLKDTGGDVPEPGSLALAGLALFAACWARKSQRRA